MLKILLVEDSPILQEMLAEMIDDIDGVELCGRATGEQEALACLNESSIDLAIVDLELNEGSGLGVLKHVSECDNASSRPRAVVFSSYAHSVVRARCEALGAEAFFDKAQGMDELIDFVEQAAAEAA
ncbi:response regulator [Nitrogeniibacter aestuarii]|uniref:response regulator n=1 Tax=Nitrogeniibacter aestuarii TaxID=2815343 RepID=UPI001E3673A6|nr:response regulator [Nitrogeniibacter aestuarii]